MMSFGGSYWDESVFPFICQTCRGDDPYLRFLKEKNEKACKNCRKPCTVFNWCPGKGNKIKKTGICRPCGVMKNMCQRCLLGLPVLVRDVDLRVRESLPTSDANREYHMQQMERGIEDNDENSPGVIGREPLSYTPLKTARTTPYYRNIPNICSFWLKGECKRAEDCPNRHERITDPDDPLADQNIRDSDDLGMKSFHEMPKPKPPEDKTNTTLYMGNLSENVKEAELKKHLNEFGEIESVTIMPHKFAFVKFATRTSAEKVVESSLRLIINGQKVNIKWFQGQSRKKDWNDGEEYIKSEHQPGSSRGRKMQDSVSTLPEFDAFSMPNMGIEKSGDVIHIDVRSNVNNFQLGNNICTNIYATGSDTEEEAVASEITNGKEVKVMMINNCNLIVGYNININYVNTWSKNKRKKKQELSLLQKKAKFSDMSGYESDFERWSNDTSDSSTAWSNGTSDSSTAWNNGTSNSSTAWSNGASNNSTAWSNDTSDSSTAWSNGTSNNSSAWSNDTSNNSTAWSNGTSNNSTAWSNDTSNNSTAWSNDTSNSSTAWSNDTSNNSTAWNNVTSDCLTTSIYRRKLVDLLKIMIWYLHHIGQYSGSLRF